MPRTEDEEREGDKSKMDAQGVGAGGGVIHRVRLQFSPG